MYVDDGLLLGDNGEVMGEEVMNGDLVGYFIPHDVAAETMGAGPTRRRAPAGRASRLQRALNRAPFGTNLSAFMPQYAGQPPSGVNLMRPTSGNCQILPNSACGPKGRFLPLGFDSVSAVAAGATAIITQRPQILFQPSRLVISGAIAAFFLVNDIKIGKNSQFGASGSLPSDVFSPTSVGVALAMDSAQVAQDIVLNVTNIDAAAHRFTAAMLGESCE